MQWKLLILLFPFQSPVSVCGKRHFSNPICVLLALLQLDFIGLEMWVYPKHTSPWRWGEGLNVACGALQISCKMLRAWRWLLLCWNCWKIWQRMFLAEQSCPITPVWSLGVPVCRSFNSEVQWCVMKSILSSGFDWSLSPYSFLWLFLVWITLATWFTVWPYQ